MTHTNRRTWLKAAALSPVCLIQPAAVVACDPAQSGGQRKKLSVAAVVTTYRTNSHADVIVGKILEGFRQDGGPGPDLRLVSLYADQVPEGDLSRRLARKHDFRICKTIDEAITLGTDRVQVGGVLSIGEHGDYPYTADTRQHMYPRRRFFDAITASFRGGGRVVPLFNDKHLSYRWSDAEHMVRTAREMKIPMMAGSSLPVTWREPPSTVPEGGRIESALAVGYGGLESYGFHALEVLQCMVERRHGGESGVAAVQAVQGHQIWEAERDGRWSRDLLQRALAATGEMPDGLEKRLGQNAAFYLIDYRDGLRATVAMANGVARHFAIALKLQGRPEPLAIWFRLEDKQPYGHFAYLLKAIEHMFHTRRPAYPVERTLLTTGVLDTVMHSLAQGGIRIATPQLDVRYGAAEWPFANAPRRVEMPEK